ncbi:MAG: hypothetical protein A2219_06065 [Elusimicrobia bacterium RIFOXYA2_FULL_50_26]|nr:MAG: hypothetical protein A2219_06065 [Elusimicrobia bacterium RIFOXYA2_FULL_50_26]OGS25149.1 MAG: hypothetical protein A2314_02810 [Elusimicrobia bacterium RIFOXYB2_FULL_50_12]
MKMDSADFKKFLASLKDTDIEELRVETDISKISFKRSNVPIVLTVADTSPKAAIPVQEEKKPVSVKSPIVGTFYHSDSPDRPPFIMEGNHVTPGRKIGIIETMKIMKDVTSTVKGKIVKVMVKNGQPVEYGQELFLVDTEDVK